MNSTSTDDAGNLDSLAEVREWAEDFQIVVDFDNANDAYIVCGVGEGFRYIAHSLDEAEAQIRTEIVSWNWGEAVRSMVDEGPDLDAVLEKIRLEACRIAVERLHEAWAACEKLKK